jgi:hypothetical protein
LRTQRTPSGSSPLTVYRSNIELRSLNCDYAAR